jgi:biopolymer transport protein ExbB
MTIKKSGLELKTECGKRTDNISGSQSLNIKLLQSTGTHLMNFGNFVKQKKILGLLALMLMFLFSVYISAYAQTPAGGTAVSTNTAAPGVAPIEVTVKKKEASMTLFQLWAVGGICMYPIGLCSIGALGLIIYGFMITNSSKMFNTDVIQQLQASMRDVKLEDAKNVCSANPGVLTNVFAAGLNRIADGTLDVESMEKAMEESSVEEAATSIKPIGYISIIAQSAPMWGLLGTVSGMIKAFQKIGLGGMGDPEKLAADIGEAMITTAFGLIVAIPAMFFFFFLKSKFNSNMSKMARVIGNLTHELTLSARRGGQAPQEESQETN